MKNKLISKKIKYDGSQLKPLFAYENFGVLGDSIVSWIGPCDVQFDHMVDLEDKIVNAKICSDEMLHFIIEVFNDSLLSAVSLQRLFAAIVRDQIFFLAQKSKNKLSPMNLTREGDDLYFIKNQKKYKLSISIASKSSISVQIHFALNTLNTGTPVPTSSLNDFKINSEVLAKNVLKFFTQEFNTIIEATKKVKPLI
jgi:hypothetical protein